MATITRNDFANRLRERFGLTTADAYKMVDVVFDEICESLINGEEVKFAGFGTFKILEKNARMGRNPKNRCICSDICTSCCVIPTKYGIS